MDESEAATITRSLEAPPAQRKELGPPLTRPNHLTQTSSTASATSGLQNAQKAPKHSRQHHWRNSCKYNPTTITTEPDLNPFRPQPNNAANTNWPLAAPRKDFDRTAKVHSQHHERSSSPKIRKTQGRPSKTAKRGLLDRTKVNARGSPVPHWRWRKEASHPTRPTRRSRVGGLSSFCLSSLASSLQCLSKHTLSAWSVRGFSCQKLRRI